MFNYIIKTLLELLTDFGPAALAIILFTITYFDWRMNKITKKLLETNFTVSDLEKENLKQVNDVRADSQRDNQNILLISEMQGKTLTEAFKSLVFHVNKNAESIIQNNYERTVQRDGLKHFSENLEQLENAVLAAASSQGQRIVALERKVQALEEDLESLQSTVGFHESIMQVRETDPIEVKPLVELLCPQTPVWDAEEVLEAEDSLWLAEEVREADPTVTGRPAEEFAAEDKCVMNEAVKALLREKEQRDKEQKDKDDLWYYTCEAIMEDAHGFIPDDF